MHYSNYSLNQPKIQQDYNFLNSRCYTSVNVTQEKFYSLEIALAS